MLFPLFSTYINLGTVGSALYIFIFYIFNIVVPSAYSTHNIILYYIGQLFYNYIVVVVVVDRTIVEYFILDLLRHTSAAEKKIFFFVCVRLTEAYTIVVILLDINNNDVMLFRVRTYVFGVLVSPRRSQTHYNSGQTSYLFRDNQIYILPWKKDFTKIDFHVRLCSNTAHALHYVRIVRRRNLSML